LSPNGEFRGGHTGTEAPVFCPFRHPWRGDDTVGA
jgi:hypothetical protein